MNIVQQHFSDFGIALNGQRDIDIAVRHGKENEFALRMLSQPNNLGLGECYVDGLWDVRDLVGLFVQLLRNGADKRRMSRNVWINDNRQCNDARTTGQNDGILCSLVWFGCWMCRTIRQLASVLFAGVFGWLGRNTSIAHRALQWAEPLTRQVFKNQGNQSITQSLQNMDVHYNLNHQFYQLMLDPWMQYSCAFYPGATDALGAGLGLENSAATTLNDAQLLKLKLIANKLALRPGMTVVDMGCGYGALSHYLAKHYRVRVVGVTLSREQKAYADTHFADANVKILLRDYRHLKLEDLPEGRPADRIVSVGLLEHVGPTNYTTFFQKCRSLLEPAQGLLLAHFIGAQKTFDERDRDPWINKYIFPNSHLPSLEQMTAASSDLFVTEDVHNFGLSYAHTLKAWRRNLEPKWQFQSKTTTSMAAEEKQTQSSGGTSDTLLGNAKFARKWDYYLCCSTALFLTRQGHLYQILFAPLGAHGKQADWVRTLPKLEDGAS